MLAAFFCRWAAGPPGKGNVVPVVCVPVRVPVQWDCTVPSLRYQVGCARVITLRLAVVPPTLVVPLTLVEPQTLYSARFLPLSCPWTLVSSLLVSLGEEERYSGNSGSFIGVDLEHCETSRTCRMPPNFPAFLQMPSRTLQRTL